MSEPISTDAHFQAWMIAPEDRRQAAHAALIGGDHTTAGGEGRALTITAAAEKAGTSRSLIYRAIRSGALSAFTPYIGANQRITEGELARWLTSRAVKEVSVHDVR